MFSKHACEKETKTLAGKAKIGQQQASQPASSSKKKAGKDGGEAVDAKRKVLKEKVRQGIASYLIHDKVSH